METHDRQNSINVQVNFFGPFITKKDIPTILDSESNGSKETMEREVLRAFFDLPFSAISQEMLERFAEATTSDSHSAIVPHTETFFKKLLKPLASAKKSYCLGDYLSTIALCGVATEMLAILIWDSNDIKLNENLISEEEEKSLFGRTFERHGQGQRLKILKAFGIIDEGEFKKLDEVRQIRRRYLHFWNRPPADEKKDALKILKISLISFKKFTGMGFSQDGRVKINPLLIKFLKGLS